MRYLGNKTKLLNFIESVINKYDIKGEIFADLFAGTCSVGDYFKNKYTIIANDYMTFSSIICKAKLLNKAKPKFNKFIKAHNTDPFSYLNNKNYKEQSNYFILYNYTPKADRMYFSESNALKIDGMRLDIEEFYKNYLIDEKEYFYLIASLLESSLKVSNTSGTYQAYFKFWEARSQKDFSIEPLVINTTKTLYKNIIYNMDTNRLIREISGDIAYIDTPYTTTQYTNSYHLLETIAKYDYPEIFGKTGRRCNREFSGYSNKQLAFIEFEDLFRQLQFEHILVSYSNQSIIPLEELINLAKKFAVNAKVYIEYSDYREYATNNLSHKSINEKLKEVIIYFKKDLSINKSPLNYSGSKDSLLPLLYKHLPKHIDTFVDAMGGAFNVGANIVAMNNVVYNEYNKYVYEIIDMLHKTSCKELIKNIEQTIKSFKLSKKDKNAYLLLREAYNKNKHPLLLFVLQIYSFQNMIRFNNSQQMNTPVGNNEYCESIKDRIEKFKTKTPNIKLICGKYQNINLKEFPKDTIFYFDPPYFITNAEYNDGKRGLDGWDVYKETELLNFLLNIHENGYKFMLSNVISHNGKIHHILKEWVAEHNFNLSIVGRTGIKYPREEVIIKNFSIYENNVNV